MRANSRDRGENWEEFAAQHAGAAGLQIIERRYCCRLGEIDLIAIDGDTLVFIEVRYRTRSDFGDAATTVTQTKQHRIVNAARHFLMRHAHFSEHPIRIDVIALQAGRGRQDGNPSIRWIRNAFDAHSFN